MRIEADYDAFEAGNRSNLSLEQVYFDIPKTIHQIWIGKQPPPQAWIDTWRQNYIQHCPGWSHQLWLEPDFSGLLYLNTALLAQEDMLCGKTDIIRGAVLYQHGGLYIDADTLWVNQHCLDDVMHLSSTTGFFAAIEPQSDSVCYHYVANGVMGAVKHHPVIWDYMQVQMEFQSTKGPAVHPFERLGPLALSEAILRADNSNCSVPDPALDSKEHPRIAWSNQVNLTGVPVAKIKLATVLHPRYFYPTTWVGVTQDVANDVVGIHAKVALEYPDAIMYQLGLSTNILLTHTSTLV
ncbi:hypothetical protein WJX82_000588 [Trebouxia sp. C0006]